MKHFISIIAAMFITLAAFNQPPSLQLPASSSQPPASSSQPPASSSQPPAPKVRMYYLGGQSNMDGCGYNAELPDSLDITFENVWIFHGNPVGDGQPNGGQGKWEPLKPGHGAYFSYSEGENRLSGRFGVELSFAYRLQQLYPGEKIALIKYSQGATSLDSMASEAGCWDPDYRGANGINQYDNFLTTVRNANMARDIDGDGRDDILAPQGIIWMQGESDAREDKKAARRYYGHLERLMGLLRAALLADDLPVVIGKITDSGQTEDGKVWEYLEVVQEAQEKFAAEDRHAAIVRSTSDYGYSDPWHYDSEGFIDLGKKFAEAIHDLEAGGIHE